MSYRDNETISWKGASVKGEVAPLSWSTVAATNQRVDFGLLFLVALVFFVSVRHGPNPLTAGSLSLESASSPVERDEKKSRRFHKWIAFGVLSVEATVIFVTALFAGIGEGCVGVVVGRQREGYGLQSVRMLQSSFA